MNAMMRYVYEAGEGAKPIEIARGGSASDFETGGASEGEEEVAAPPPPGTAAQAHEDPIDAFLRKQRDNAAPTAPAPPSRRPRRRPPRSGSRGAAIW